MFSAILIFLLATLVGSPGVEGATCTTATTCQATDFTLSTCTGGTCGCLNSSFVAIRSGCALQLEKPVITPLAGRTNQVMDGQSFALTCIVSGAATYEWYKGSTNLATATNTYTATASSTTVGSFTCKGIGSDTVLTSPMSDAFTVVLLGASATSAVQPVLTLSVTTPVLASSSAITLSCTNIPMGYTDTITYKVNAVAITGTTVTIDSSNAGKDAICELTTPSTSGVTFSSPASAAVKLPTLVTNIQTVTVTAASQTVTEVLAGSSVTLTCSHIPAVGYLGGPAVTPTYAWQKDGSTITSETSATLLVSASGSYSCTAQLASQTTVSSTNKVKVTIASTILDASAHRPIKGGRVILTCGDIRTDNPIYTWTKGVTVISRQLDRKLHLDNVDATTDDGAYSCTAVGNQFYLSSEPENLAVQTKIDTPTISAGCSRHYGENGDFTLGCYTDSETIGMTYEWTVKGVVSSVNTKFYSLKAITSANNGDYVCKAKFGSATSDPSPAETVTVTKPGLFCYHDNVCIAAKTGYSGKCDVNDRCTCSDGYSQKGEVCTNGVVQVVSSLAVILLTLVITKFL